MTNTPLITWNNWADGMGDSPHVGIGLIKAADVGTFPGAARVGKKPVSVFHTEYSHTFTADAGTDVCTGSSATVPATGTAATVSTTGTLPAGLSASTNYFIIKVSDTTFKLATTVTNADAGTAINITDAGSGTHTVATVEPGTVNHYARDPRTNTIFMQDSNARVWYLQSGSAPARLLNGNTTTSGAGNGIAVFRVSDGTATYLLAFRNASVDVVNVFGSSQLGAPSWTNSWKSLNSGAGSGNSHHARLGQDNIVYFTDDRYVGSIQETPGDVFDPSDSASYTFNNQALDLPLGSLAYWLEELGVDLIVSVSNDDKLYPWDRSSDSYGLPIPIGEYGGNKMKNIGNIVYVLAGQHGNIYKTQGTYVRLFKTLPIYATYNTTTPASNSITWGGIEAVLGNLLVGVGSTSSGYSGAYLVTPGGKLTIDNQPTTGNVRPTALFAQNGYEFYHMGYSGGADVMDSSRYSSLGTVVLQSRLYRVGNHTQKATISELEFQIATPVAGSIRVKYRKDTSSSFSDLPAPSSSTITTTTSDSGYSLEAGLTDLENVQFQLELSGSLDLMEMRAYE